MKNTITFFTFFFLTITFAHAQIFNNVYELADDPNEGISSSQSSMVIDADGSTISVHNVQEINSPVPNANNVHIIKVDKFGALLWSRRYGEANYDEKGHGICQTEDGGYLVAGSRGKFQGNTFGWIFKLDANGNLLWDRVYIQGQANIENLLVARTPETPETYFVVGRTFPSDKVTAMKILSDGQAIWNNRYQKANILITDTNAHLASSMVYDAPNSGYVIAGTESNGRESVDLFTLGVGLDGSIFDDYRRFDMGWGRVESQPHIIKDFYDYGFMMAFGVINPEIGQFSTSSIVALHLSPDLFPVEVFTYSPAGFIPDPEDQRYIRANSIIVDPAGYYALGCMTTNTYGFITGADDRSSFLRIDLDGAPIDYYNYNLGVDAACTFMAQDLEHQNYVLKTDQNISNEPGLGLIRTNFDGASDCAVRETIPFDDDEIFLSREDFEATNYAPQYLPVMATAWDDGVNPIGCNVNSGGNRSIQKLEKPDLDIKGIIAYPSLVEADMDAFVLEYDAETDQEIMIRIFSSNGQLTHFISHNAIKGKNKMEVSSAYLSNGINTINLFTNNKITGQVRVIKI